MPFHTTQLERPVVTDVPTTNVCRFLNARTSNSITSLPASVSGRKPVRDVPSYGTPGLGSSSFWMPLGNTYLMMIVPSRSCPANGYRPGGYLLEPVSSAQHRKTSVVHAPSDSHGAFWHVADHRCVRCAANRTLDTMLEALHNAVCTQPTSGTRRPADCADKACTNLHGSSGHGIVRASRYR